MPVKTDGPSALLTRRSFLDRAGRFFLVAPMLSFAWMPSCSSSGNSGGGSGNKGYTGTDDQLLDAMVAHPILMNRPIVVTPMGVRLCRPAESVLDIFPAGPGV